MAAVKKSQATQFIVAAMPFAPAPESKKIQYLRRQLHNGRSEKGRELTEEDKQRLQAALDSEMAKRKEGIVKRIETKVAAEQDRGIAHTTKESDRIIATLGEKLDRLGASSSSSGRDDLLQRLVGQPGSSKEIQAEIDARKEDLKRKRREEREEDKQAEKRRKLEEKLEVALEEGDTLQDGVVLRGDLGRRKMRGLQAVGDFRFGRLRCCLVEIGETATLQLDPLNDQQLTVLGSMAASNNWPGTIVKLLAVTKDGTVEAQFLKEKLCGPNRRPIKQPLAVRFTSRNFHPSQVFAPKPAEEPVQPTQPAQPTQPVEPASVEPVAPAPVEPDAEMTEKSAEEPDVEMTEKPADEDLESTSSGGVELWEVALGGSNLRFSVDRVTGVSALGHERLITPVKEDFVAFRNCRHQGLRDLHDGQFLLSARLWNESVTKASSPTVSATASEAPAEAAPEAAPGGSPGGSPGGARGGSPGGSPGGARGGSPGSSLGGARGGSLGSSLGGARGGSSDLPVWRGGARRSGWLRNFQLKASTLQEYREALPILQERMADGSVDSCSLMIGVEKGKERWNTENQPYHITRNDKLMLPKAKKSVRPEDAIVEIHWA